MDDQIISDDGLERIRATLPPGASFRSPPIEVAAAAYETFKQKEDSRTGKGMKADLRALARKLDKAADGLSELTSLAIAAIGVCAAVSKDRSDAVPRMQRLEKELRWLSSTIDDTVKTLRRPIVDRTPTSLTLTIFLLAAPYRRATGAAITHSAHRDGDYIGRALSPFGQFLAAFFAEVDPTVSETSIGNVIRKHRIQLNQRTLD